MPCQFSIVGCCPISEAASLTDFWRWPCVSSRERNPPVRVGNLHSSTALNTAQVCFHNCHAIVLLLSSFVNRGLLGCGNLERVSAVESVARIPKILSPEAPTVWVHKGPRIGTHRGEACPVVWRSGCSKGKPSSLFPIRTTLANNSEVGAQILPPRSSIR